MTTRREQYIKQQRHTKLKCCIEPLHHSKPQFTDILKNNRQLNQSIYHIDFSQEPIPPVQPNQFMPYLSQTIPTNFNQAETQNRQNVYAQPKALSMPSSQPLFYGKITEALIAGYI